VLPEGLTVGPEVGPAVVGAALGDTRVVGPAVVSTSAVLPEGTHCGAELGACGGGAALGDPGVVDGQLLLAHQCLVLQRRLTVGDLRWGLLLRCSAENPKSLRPTVVSTVPRY
jgi:hypothetical protein